MMQEKRQVVRWKAGSTVKYRIKGSGSEHNGWGEDISLRGMRLKLDERIEPETELELEVVLLDDAGAISTEGKIVWDKKIRQDDKTFYQAGLRFTRFKDSDKDRVMERIYRYMPEEVHKHWWEGFRCV